MTRFRLLFFIQIIYYVNANLNYLDPTKLQTITSPEVQEKAANAIIDKYLIRRYVFYNVTAEVNPDLFKDKKDTFILRTEAGNLRIFASTGVAAVWGYNFFLKKYCKSQVAWQQHINVQLPDKLPDINETVTANDRFRYYQNERTASISFLWWNDKDWMTHLEWMALNGINLALAPIAQESLWMEIYKNIGMTDEEIEDHFTGPAFLPWLRMGNVRGWGGPLPSSWHKVQQQIQMVIVPYMVELGMVPVLPAFNGHVPKAFARVFPNAKLLQVSAWNQFENEYSSGVFIDPNDPLFQDIGNRFLKNVVNGNVFSHVYIANPFTELKAEPWSLELLRKTSDSIFSTLLEVDENAVWLVPSSMFSSSMWPKPNVEAFLTSVPNGRMLILDMESEYSPLYDYYDMYYGRPFIWCMLHNYGGTLGMFGDMKTINEDVYEVRARPKSSMIGIGLTPEGINQNYVVYDLMLESAWRHGPVDDLEKWVAEYAERRYGCNSAATAWKYLLKSVYSNDKRYKVSGKYVITSHPSFSLKPWAWYSSKDLFNAFKHFVHIENTACNTNAFYYDLVDVTRQALQYRAEQLYVQLEKHRVSFTWVYEESAKRFLDAMSDIESILARDDKFKFETWFIMSNTFTTNALERFVYQMNARNLVTLWGPKGELSDYAGKQWADMFHYYYIPRWTTFLEAAISASSKKQWFEEPQAKQAVRVVEEKFTTVSMLYRPPYLLVTDVALNLYRKWAFVSGLDDLARYY